LETVKETFPGCSSKELSGLFPFRRIKASALDLEKKPEEKFYTMEKK
jgi:hypothetical protein